MALPSLATPQQLATALGRAPFQGDELEQVELLLDWASDELRAIIGQPLSRDTSTVVLYGEPSGVIRLPAIPVVSVADVQVRNRSVEFEVRRVWLYSDEVSTGDEVTVTYTHGYDPIPGELVKWTCVLANSLQGAASESGSLGMTAGVASRSEQIDDYQYSTAAPSGGSGSGGMSLPSGVASRLKATYGGGSGMGWVTYG